MDTLNEDNDGNLESVSVIGTASANTSFKFNESTSMWPLPSGNNISLTISDGVNGSNYNAQADIYANGTYVKTIQKGAVDYPTHQYSGTLTAGVIRIYVNSGVTINAVFKLQIELGTSATPFAPYTGITIPISWESSAGTVYGGALDLTNGVLTVTDANIASYNGETLPDEWISDRDVYFAGATPTTGAQVVYKLATPQTYQLTPTEVTTLLGTNNIWEDCGPVSVDYPADTKLYIQKANKPTDDDMTADTQIASGKYFIIGNTLYLSTTVIPAGDTIIPGTNCQKTNLAEALNALNT